MSITDKYDIFYDEDNKAYQVRTKSDVIAIEFIDQEKENIFLAIIGMYNEKDYYTFKQLNERLSKKYPYAKILDVVQELTDCYILNDDNFEPGSDLHRTESEYATYMCDTGNIKDLAQITIGYIGEESLGLLLKEKAVSYEYKSFNILLNNDSVTEKSISDFVKKHDFIIFDSSEWNPYITDIMNTECLKQNRPWLYVDGPIDLVNYGIGPLFHGKDTGCYECYRNRVRSNDEFFSFTDSYEKYLTDNKKKSKSEVVNNLTKDIVSSIIIMEVSKYMGGWYPPETWRATLIFNTQNYQLARHDFLKAPICYKCKPVLDYNPSPWLESVTLNKAE